MFFRHRNCVGKTEKVDPKSEQQDIVACGFRHDCFFALTDEAERAADTAGGRQHEKIDASHFWPS